MVTTTLNLLALQILRVFCEIFLAFLCQFHANIFVLSIHGVVKNCQGEQEESGAYMQHHDYFTASKEWNMEHRMTYRFGTEILPEEDIVLQNSTCFFIMSNDEVLHSSGMIIPFRVVATPFELTSAEWADTHGLLCQAKAYLDQRYCPDGYTVGWNVGATGGQHVFHAHLHLIARYADEPYAGKGVRHWLKSRANARG
jgi:diadenosine tetraphosphate (Ap4A) HIT family hydrolase